MKYKWSVIQTISLILAFVILSTACGTSQPTVVSTLSSNTKVPANIPIESLIPSPRAYTSLAYDTESNRIILFGGQTGDYTDSTSYNGETWAYDFTVNRWLQMKPTTGPTKRIAAELVYDAESDRIILFGGSGDPDMSTWGKMDTWAYDYNTNTWTEMAKGPNRHVGPRLAYDSESDRVILFGGYDMSDFFYNETWAYDFNTNTWTEMKPKTSPPGRNFHAMTYDSKADRILVWGGLNTTGTAPVDESIWAYDYNTNLWQEIKPGDGSHPAGRDRKSVV
jgi:N-acetylneuraminic acid mutarotase